MKKNHSGKILYNKEIADMTYKSVIVSDVDKIDPGQFLSFLIPNKTLRRPFSVMDFSNGEISVIYKLKGEGTKYLSSLKSGDSVDFLCPLGNKFNYENKKSALLIGAGIGIAPMLFLKKNLCALNIENYLITGFKDEKEVIEGSDKTVIGGSVVDHIEDLISSKKPDVIYSCGPYIVLKLLAEISVKHNIEFQAAMEKTMACGIGVCRGCVIKLKDKNASVCKDGPVFLGDEVVWE